MHGTLNITSSTNLKYVIYILKFNVIGALKMHIREMKMVDSLTDPCNFELVIALFNFSFCVLG